MVKKSACQCRRSGFDPWVGKIPWRRERLPTSVFLPGKFHGQRVLAGYSPWSCKELDMAEQLTLTYLMLRMLSTFSCANLPLIYFPWWSVYLNLCSFFLNWVVHFFIIEFWKLSMRSGHKTCARCLLYKYFLPACGLFFILLIWLSESRNA